MQTSRIEKEILEITKQIPVSLSGTKDRLGYIGKENDIESGLGDFGVRKYDNRGGRFLSY